MWKDISSKFKDRVFFGKVFRWSVVQYCNKKKYSPLMLQSRVYFGNVSMYKYNSRASGLKVHCGNYHKKNKDCSNLTVAMLKKNGQIM